jgi:hypothetical protein
MTHSSCERFTANQVSNSSRASLAAGRPRRQLTSLPRLMATYCASRHRAAGPSPYSPCDGSATHGLAGPDAAALRDHGDDRLRRPYRMGRGGRSSTGPGSSVPPSSRMGRSAPTLRPAAGPADAGSAAAAPGGRRGRPGPGLAALVKDRQRGAAQKLDRAHMLLNIDEGKAARPRGRREPIPREVRRVVFERDGAECVETSFRYSAKAT